MLFTRKNLIYLELPATVFLPSLLFDFSLFSQMMDQYGAGDTMSVSLRDSFDLSVTIICLNLLNLQLSCACAVNLCFPRLPCGWTTWF